MLLQEAWGATKGVGRMIRRGKMNQGLTGAAAVRIDGRKLPVGWRRRQMRSGEGLLRLTEDAVMGQFNGK